MQAPGKSPATFSLREEIRRYSLAPLFLTLAVLLSALLHAAVPHSIDYVFLAAVVGAAWLGGRGPGLCTALLAPLVLDYFFLPPLYTLGFSPEARPYIVPFLLSGFAAAWMSSTRGAARDARTQLSASEERFRRILTNQPDVAWTRDSSGRHHYLSPKIAQILGFTSEELRDGGFELVLAHIHPEDRALFQKASDDLFSGRGPFDLEFRFQRRDGAWVWLHDRATATYRQNGLTLADGVLSDVSARKEAEVELRSKTAFLEAQANATIDAILVVDAAGSRILQNSRFNEIFAIPAHLRDSADDTPVLQHVVQLAKDPQSFLARVQELYDRPEKTSRDEVELTNGTILDRYSSPVRGPAGEYYGRIWTFRDITERRQRENALHQLSAAVEQSPVSVVITDPEGNITYVNPRFTTLTGYTPAEVTGQNPRILNSGYSPPEAYRDLWAKILAGQEWRGEFRNRKKNGELYWEAAVISPIFDSKRQITHFIAVKEDITERRALENQLRQAQKMEGIGQLAAGIAHEINTPAQFVTDNLTFLEDAWTATLSLLRAHRSAAREHLPPAVVQALAQAEEQCDFAFIQDEVPHAIAQGLEGARRVATIVRAMKEFSHPDVADKIEADLNRGIASTITIASNAWKYVADVETDFDPALPPVLCYPGDINQVVLNLLVNAAHAIEDKPGRHEKGRITIRTRRGGEGVEISVADTGVGIAPEIQSRIFELFFTTREVGSGTGQGLALAHTVIVKKHQGRIWFETRPGQGTTFFIQLPIRPHAQEPA